MIVFEYQEKSVFEQECEQKEKKKKVLIKRRKKEVVFGQDIM